MDTEIWKDIEGYEGFYQISNLGRVKSLSRIIYNKDNVINRIKREKVIRQNNCHGYLVVTFGIKGIREAFRVHRLIAKAFIPNPNNKPMVNHIDGNKSNNTIENLEWVNGSENQFHAYRIGIKKPTNLGRFGADHNKSKSVCQFSLSGEYINEYGSTKEAFRETGISFGNISWCALGHYSHAGGYKWKYKNDIINSNLN